MRRRAYSTPTHSLAAAHARRHASRAATHRNCSVLALRFARHRSSTNRRLRRSSSSLRRIERQHAATWRDRTSGSGLPWRVGAKLYCQLWPVFASARSTAVRRCVLHLVRILSLSVCSNCSHELARCSYVRVMSSRVVRTCAAISTCCVLVAALFACSNRYITYLKVSSLALRYVRFNAVMSASPALPQGQKPCLA